MSTRNGLLFEVSTESVSQTLTVRCVRRGAVVLAQRAQCRKDLDLAETANPSWHARGIRQALPAFGMPIRSLPPKRILGDPDEPSASLMSAGGVWATVGTTWLLVVLRRVCGSPSAAGCGSTHVSLSGDLATTGRRSCRRRPRGQYSRRRPTSGGPRPDGRRPPSSSRSLTP